MEFIWFLIIGALAGWIAGEIMKGSGFGIIGNIIVGIIGAFVGGLLFSFFGVPDSGLVWSLVSSIVGAVVFLFIVSLFR